MTFAPALSLVTHAATPSIGAPVLGAVTVVVYAMAPVPALTRLETATSSRSSLAALVVVYADPSALVLVATSVRLRIVATSALIAVVGV
jgi:hypothetical protein